MRPFNTYANYINWAIAKICEMSEAQFVLIDNGETADWSEVFKIQDLVNQLEYWTSFYLRSSQEAELCCDLIDSQCGNPQTLPVQPTCNNYNNYYLSQYYANGVQASGSGGGSSAVWGLITGTLSDQLDLQAVLNTKMTANANITAGSRKLVDYDIRGLVLAGYSLDNSDVAPLAIVGDVGGTIGATVVNWLNGATALYNSLYAPISGALPPLNNGSLWIGDGSNVATARTLTGDVSTTNTGVTSVAWANGLSTYNAQYLQLTGGTLTGNLNGVTPTQLTYLNSLTSNVQTQLDSKLAGTLANGKIWIGDVTNAPIATTLTGDITVTNTGLTAIGANKVLNSMIGEAVNVAHGGNGLTTIAQGSILYGSATDVYSALAKNTTATRYLSNTGTSNNPAWAQVNLADGVTGTLPLANGGNGITSGTSGGVPYFSSTSTIASSGLLGANQLVLGGGAGVAPSTSSSLTFASSVLTLTGSQSIVGSADVVQLNVKGNGTQTSNLFNLATSANASQFSVSNAGVTTIAGATTISSGGLTLTSGNAVLTSGNLTLTSGNATLTAGNFTMTLGNATITGNAGVALTVNSVATLDGVLINNNSTTSNKSGLAIVNTANNQLGLSIVASATNTSTTSGLINLYSSAYANNAFFINYNTAGYIDVVSTVGSTTTTGMYVRTTNSGFLDIGGRVSAFTMTGASNINTRVALNAKFSGTTFPKVCQVLGEYTASSGTGSFACLSLEPTINTSATGSTYYGIYLSATETAVGTGTQYLAWMGVGGTAKSYITNKGLLFSNAQSTNYVTKSANYTVDSTAGVPDYTIDCTSSPTITLPTAVGQTGRIYCIKNSGSGTTTVNTTSSQTIDGSTTQTINTQYAGIMVQSNGTNYIIISRF